MFKPEEMMGERDSGFIDGKLDEKHRYWMQVQGQMAVSGQKWSDFVVYTHRYV